MAFRYHIWTCCAREGCWFSTWWWNPWLSSNNCMVIYGPGISSKLWQISFWIALIYTWRIWPQLWVNPWTSIRRPPPEGGTWRRRWTRGWSLHKTIKAQHSQRKLSQREEPPPGSSQQREEPGDRWWEDHRSSPGSPGSRINLPPEEVGLDAEEEQDPYFEAEDHVQEEAAFWVTEDQLEGDYLSGQATSSVSASNPGVLYEAGVICSRLPDGSLEHKSSGERIISLREWGLSFTDQRVILRHQDIGRPEWEKLPWACRTPLLSCHKGLGSWKMEIAS